MRLDPHSYNDAGQPEVTHVVWRARVDFAQRTLTATARLVLKTPAAGGPLDPDTRDLTIRAVRGADGAALPFALDPAEAWMGARLRVTVPAGARELTIEYATAPQASALQWL